MGIVASPAERSEAVSEVAPQRPSGDDDERPVLPSRSDDDSDVGWGDEPGGRDADWYERERPPHHE